jgi:protoheme IX farnesyltransferase
MERPGFRTLVLLTAVLVYGTIVMGGYVRGSGSGLGCPSWPSCEPGRYLPDLANGHQVVEWSHRFLALCAGLSIIATFASALFTQRHDKRLLLAVTLAFLLLPLQAGLGALTVASGLNPALSAAHMGVAAALFGSIVAAAIFAHLGPRQPARAPAGEQAPAGEPAPPRPLKDAARDYAVMVKPGILFLVVLTGLAGLVLAGGRQLSPLTASLTLVGGALSAAAASAFNHYLERDADARMARTRRRPLPSHRVREGRAFWFATSMALAAFALLALFVNFLAACLSLAGLFFYIAVYTVWLKKATPQNIVIGGAAGSFPALVGWAAVTGTIGLPALLLGALVFLWTPPHFWALALVYKDDYARGGFPMMPNVRGEEHTRREIWWYSVALVAASLLFVWPLGVLGSLYLLAAVVLGGLFCRYAWLLMRTPDARAASRLFHYSIWYLMGLFAAIGADALL